MNSSIFITYNHESKAEESTALRLQTISNLYGFSINLPNRLGVNKTVSNETMLRILNSNFVVAFCIDGLDELLKNEVQYAISINKPLIVIYDNEKRKTINFENISNVIEVFVDFNKTDDALHSIAEFLRRKLVADESKLISGTEKDSGLGIALLGIGLGLLAAWSFSQDN